MIMNVYILCIKNFFDSQMNIKNFILFLKFANCNVQCLSFESKVLTSEHAM
jgi:hypothetical protein